MFVLFVCGMLCLGATLVAVPWAAWALGHVAYFPIHLSKCATKAPLHALFAAGLLLSAMLMLPLFMQHHALPGTIACIVLPWAGVISEKRDVVVHTLLATVAMGLFSLQAVRFAGLTVSWALALVFNASNMALLLPVLHLHLRELPPWVWLTELAMDFKISDAHIVSVLRMRGLLQWLAIMSLGTALWDSVLETL